MILFAAIYFLSLCIGLYLVIILDNDNSKGSHFLSMIFSLGIASVMTLLLKETGVDDITLIKYVYGFIGGTIVVYNVFLRIKKLPFIR